MDLINSAAHNVIMAHVSNLVSDVMPELVAKFRERYAQALFRDTIAESVGMKEQFTQAVVEEIMHEMLVGAHVLPKVMLDELAEGSR